MWFTTPLYCWLLPCWFRYCFPRFWFGSLWWHVTGLRNIRCQGYYRYHVFSLNIIKSKRICLNTVVAASQKDPWKSPCRSYKPIISRVFTEMAQHFSKLSKGLKKWWVKIKGQSGGAYLWPPTSECPPGWKIYPGKFKTRNVFSRWLQFFKWLNKRSILRISEIFAVKAS